MSDYKGLVFTLRSMRNEVCNTAAEKIERQSIALEAMAGEVERLTTNGIHSCWEECPRLPCVQGREIRALTAERDRLAGEVETAKSQFKALQMVTSKEHEDTRAERDRLKAALETIRQIVRMGPDHVSDDDISKVSATARKALGGGE